MPVKQQLVALLDSAARAAFPGQEPAIVLDRPKIAAHGDFACNAAMQLARALKRNPREIAQALLAALPPSPLIDKAEIAGAGFINLFASAAAKQSVVHEILAAGERYGTSGAGQGERVMIEFVSANPTGPLHVGHGRGAAVGDTLANLLASQSWRVYREFYYNDAGAQIDNLVKSVAARVKQLHDPSQPFPQDAYHGDYIKDLARDYVAAYPHDALGEDAEAIRRFAVAALRREQDLDLDAFGVRFDHYYLESSLYAEGRVDATVQKLIGNRKTFEQEGALWLRTTEYGDDKDRVARKSDGSYTYFVPDVAYHVSKWERGFKRVINEQGADHHSTVTRVRAGLQALDMGIPKDYPEYVLHQMVTVMKGGEEVKISKRAGSYVTVRDLVDEVGRDAVRFFFVMRKHDSHLTFDVDLARSKSEENPVYYVQYAHARIASVLREWGGDEQALIDAPLGSLTTTHAFELMQSLAEYPETVAGAANECSPHLVAFYVRELAGRFHAWYNAERILVGDVAERHARLALCLATRQVLRNGLAILGVSAPERM